MTPTAHLTRRRLVAALASTPLLGMSGVRPDLVLHRANVVTVDPGLPHAEAIAIRGDRILHVGRDDEVLALATAATKKIDLGGATVLPGFVDAHSHPAYAGLRHLTSVDCDLRSIDCFSDTRYRRKKSSNAACGGSPHSAAALCHPTPPNKQ
jgi:predicted amidohydrolase YtcJ